MRAVPRVAKRTPVFDKPILIKVSNCLLFSRPVCSSVGLTDCPSAHVYPPDNVRPTDCYCGSTMRLLAASEAQLRSGPSTTRLFEMTRCSTPPKTTAMLFLASALPGGCSAVGAPSFDLFGAFFPAWLLCGVIGIVGAGAARAAFVGTGLANIIPYQLFVCTAIGVIAAVLSWLLFFGR